MDRLEIDTEDVPLAEETVARAFVPSRIETLDERPFAMSMRILTIAGLTVGRVAFQTAVRVTSVALPDVHVGVPLIGAARARRGADELVATSPSTAVVYGPGSDAEVEWDAGGTQLWLTVALERLESQVERLTGTTLRTPLTFDFAMPLDTAVGRRWSGALRLIDDELDEPSLLGEHPGAAEHAAAVILDGLLLGHRHSATEALLDAAPRAGPRAVARAVELLEGDPGHPWTVVALAQQVHLSVRSLQEGFRRELGVSPMAYLRRVRLRRARARLVAAAPQETTVRAVAGQFGLFHLGRFAHAYRETYGEPPSHTLARPPG